MFKPLPMLAALLPLAACALPPEPGPALPEDAMAGNSVLRQVMRMQLNNTGGPAVGVPGMEAPTLMGLHRQNGRTASPGATLGGTGQEAGSGNGENAFSAPGGASSQGWR